MIINYTTDYKRESDIKGEVDILDLLDVDHGMEKTAYGYEYQVRDKTVKEGQKHA